MLLIAISLTSTAVTFSKDHIHRERPDGSGFRSFPSSHTAMAFMSAEFMHQEYKDQSVWFSIAGYAMATTTGVLRLYHHVHWLSDIVMGGGYGILSTKIAYLIYPYLKNIFVKKNNSKLSFMPILQNEYQGISLNFKF
jgi:membrane-associated phospholipid phosphatase